MRTRTHVDLCSGIGGFSLGLGAAGFKTIAFSEIDPYASAVLKKHWPWVQNYGDNMHPALISLKQWRLAEADRLRISPQTVANHYYQGQYSGVRVKRLNGRVVLVINGTRIKLPTAPTPTEVPFKAWTAQESERLGITRAGVMRRVQRGRYPGLHIRRVNKRVLYVEPMRRGLGEWKETDSF